MSIMQTLMRRLQASERNTPGQVTTFDELPPAEQYDLLEAFYEGNGLYVGQQSAMYAGGSWVPAMKSLMTCAYRACEFYPKKLWAGPLESALPIVTDNERLPDAIRQVWDWSNWAAKKQVAARWLAIYGDLFINVATQHVGDDPEMPATRVNFELVKPKYVTDFAKDERGIITYIRFDTPQEDRSGDAIRKFTRTEIWTEAGYRRWDSDTTTARKVEQLGAPDVEIAMGQFGKGVDFIPVVHAPFIDEGDLRGAACIMPVLDKLNELNAMVTRRHQMMFRWNKQMLAITGQGKTKDGRVIPAVRVRKSDGVTLDDGETWTVEDDFVMSLPGDADVKSLVPSIDWDALGAAAADMYNEIRRDLPELRYSDLEAGANQSGTALRLMLSDCIDKVLEVRGNAEAALVRADMMAISIAQAHGLEGFNVGSYDAGELAHTFAARDVIPQMIEEVAATTKVFVDMGVPAATALVKYAGWSDDEAAEMAAVLAPAPVSIMERTPQEQALVTEEAVQRAAVEVKPALEAMMNAITDGIEDHLLKTGALEALMAARAPKEG